MKQVIVNGKWNNDIKEKIMIKENTYEEMTLDRLNEISKMIEDKYNVEVNDLSINFSIYSNSNGLLKKIELNYYHNKGYYIVSENDYPVVFCCAEGYFER
jgi:uncharacterized phosphosugar-binding protein